MTILVWFLVPLIAVLLFLGTVVGSQKVKGSIDARKEEKREIEAKDSEVREKKVTLKKAVRRLARDDIEWARNHANDASDEEQDKGPKTDIYSFLPDNYRYVRNRIRNHDSIGLYDDGYILTKQDLAYIQELYPQMVEELYAEEAGNQEISTEFDILDQVRNAHIRRISFEEKGRMELAQTAQSSLDKDFEELNSLISNNDNNKSEKERG